ncbi:MAG: lysophospholipid acyltransferase family protein [Limisphaerales bacterium]
MKGFRRHPFRVLGRLVWFGFEVLQALGIFLVHCVFCPKASARRLRALWLQRTARHVGRIFRLEVQCAGTLPTHGLLISNHVSYVDILVLASLMPTMFVAKREVKSWPVMGFLSQLAGTLFIDRQRRTHVGEVNNEIQAALNDGALVIVFPEGTSSNGRNVLPFKSSLLEPAAQQKHPLTIARINYVLEDGGLDEETAYWGEAVFFPHLLNLLSRPKIRASVHFTPVEHRSPDRKQLAQQLHIAVLALKN